MIRGLIQTWLVFLVNWDNDYYSNISWSRLVKVARHSRNESAKSALWFAAVSLSHDSPHPPKSASRISTTYWHHHDDLGQFFASSILHDVLRRWSHYFWLVRDHVYVFYLRKHAARRWPQAEQNDLEMTAFLCFCGAGCSEYLKSHRFPSEYLACT